MDTTCSSWLWPSNNDEGGTQQINPSTSPSERRIAGYGCKKKIISQQQKNQPLPPQTPNSKGPKSTTKNCMEITNVRVPELSLDYCSSSPGTRQDDDSPPKRIAFMEAYNKGMLLQYMINSASEIDYCCNNKHVAEDDYETKWRGHQPLTPSTWSSAKNDYIDELNDTSGSVVSASEQRFMRRRRRRGVLPPSKRGEDNNNNISMHVTKANNNNNNVEPQRDTILPGWGIPFPGDVIDPHFVSKKKEKWHPNI